MSYLSDLIICTNCQNIFNDRNCKDWDEEMCRCGWCLEDNHSCPKCDGKSITFFSGIVKDVAQITREIELYWLAYHKNKEFMDRVFSFALKRTKFCNLNLFPTTFLQTFFLNIKNIEMKEYIINNLEKAVGFTYHV